MRRFAALPLVVLLALVPIHAAASSFFGSQFSSTAFCTFSHQNESVSGNVLTVTYPAGSSAPSAGAPFGGAQECHAFTAGGQTDATLTYDVRFPVGFQFVKGGKLPGVYGGSEPFSGGKHNPNGWSMRLMWRAGGAAEVYGYISTTTGYGDDWGRGNFTYLADGQFHRLTEHVHLNSPGLSDGSVTLAYDGVVRIVQTGLAITTTGTPVSGLFFSTFYGGHDASWSPTADQHVDFANFSTDGTVAPPVVTPPPVSPPPVVTPPPGHHHKHKHHRRHHHHRAP